MDTAYKWKLETNRDWEELLGISGGESADAMMEQPTGSTVVDPESHIAIVKLHIDAMLLSMTRALGAGQAVSIVYDTLDDETTFGLVGRAYLRAPNVCRVTLGYDPDETTYRPVGMTIETVASIIGRRRKNGRIIDEDVREIVPPSTQTIIDLMKTFG